MLADGANGSGTIFFKLDQSNHDLAIMRSTFRCTFSRRVREGNEGFTSQNGANAEPKTVGELSSFSSPSLQIPRTIFHGFYSTIHSEWKSFIKVTFREVSKDEINISWKRFQMEWLRRGMWSELHFSKSVDFWPMCSNSFVIALFFIIF